MTAVTSKGRSLLSQIPEGPRNLVLAISAAFMAAVASQVQSVARLAVGGVGLFVIILITLSDRELALVSITIWMVFLGFIRRFLIPFAGWSPQDPLLLVSPAVAAVLLITGRRLGTPPRTMLSTTAIFLMLWSGTQVFNPNETSLLAPLQACLFFVTPPLWFLVGRTLTLAQHDRILRVLFWCSVPVVAHGLQQSFFGLFPFELTWIGVSDIGPSIFLPGFVIRPFSTLVSPQEYGIFLAMALAIIYVRILTPGSRRGWLIAYFFITAFALFLQASRTTFILFLLTIAVLTIVRVRSLPVLMATSAIGVALILYSLANPVAPVTEEKQPAPGEASNVGASIGHQLSGLTNPGQSTAPLHITLVADSLETAFKHPLGLGASNATIASTTFNTNEFKSAENDVANTMSSLGLPAGLALILFIFLGIGGARRLYRATGDNRYLIWLGFGVACMFNWYVGGQYTTTMILWLSMGGVARQIGEQTAARLRAITPAGADVT